MSAIDTPDNQRGVVNAQALLSAAAGGTQLVNLALPPNCETLIVVVPAVITDNALTCVGAISNVSYPVVKAAPSRFSNTTSAFICDVSNVIDAEVDVSWTNAPGIEWYIYSDAGVHVITDVGSDRDINGGQFVVPSVPYADKYSHPRQEVLFTSVGLAANGAVLAAPGAGNRYRIFGASMSTPTAGLEGGILDVATSQTLLSCAGAGNAVAHLPAQGVPLSTNAALEYELFAGAGTMTVCVQYTEEVV